MAIVPDFVRLVVRAYRAPLFQRFSDQIYAELLKRATNHFLVHLHTTLDWAPLEAACADFHHAHGPGAPPIHPVQQLVRALLIGALFNWSQRQLEFHLRFNLLVNKKILADEVRVMTDDAGMITQSQSAPQTPRARIDWAALPTRRQPTEFTAPPLVNGLNRLSRLRYPAPNILLAVESAETVIGIRRSTPISFSA